MSKGAVAAEDLGLAGDSVSLEVAVLHAGEGPEDARHHLLCSTLHTPNLAVTGQILDHGLAAAELCSLPVSLDKNRGDCYKWWQKHLWEVAQWLLS